MQAIFGIIVVAVLGQYEPPLGYYNTATGTGAVLEGQLHNIIDNHVVRSYDDARFAFALLDEDPNNPDNIILIYDGLSVDSTWDQGVTYNREHIWPRSRQIIGDGSTDTGPDNSDMHILRPCTTSVNGDRGTRNFGGFRATFGPSGVYWYPGHEDTGDVARAMFYMQVRYDGSDPNTDDLELVNGNPDIRLGQLGDLASLLQWHYSDPVSETEQRRNHLLWSSQDNPLYYQNNRNPFIDRPEFVWAIWGTADNDSTLYFGSTAPGDGASSVPLLLQVINGAAAPTTPVTLSKIGTTPTTFDISATGDAVVTPAGTGHAFVGGTQSQQLSVGVASAAATGLYSGTVTVDNTDLTSAGAGQGSGDGDDVINLTVEVLDHSEASFSAGGNVDTLVIDFGEFFEDTGVQTLTFDVFNLESTPGLTAALRLITASGAGDTGVLYSDIAPFDDLAAGQGQSFTAYLDTGAGEGAFETVYQLDVSDEDLPGGQSGDTLTLTLLGTVNANAVPAASTFGAILAGVALLAAASAALKRHRRLRA